MQISILGTDGAYLANNGSNAISILGPDGNLLPNDGSNFVCVTGSDGAYQANDGTVEAFSILGTDGALKPYEADNSYSVLDENGALAIPITDNLISTLLWGGAQGAWYDPSDLSTMFTTAASQTPVTASGDVVGLILDKRLGLALGSPTGTNRDFASSGTDWSVVNNDGTHVVTFGVGSCRYQSDTTSPQLLVQQGTSLTPGLWYRVDVTISSHTSGSIKVLGGAVEVEIPGAVGTHTRYLLANSTVLSFTRSTTNVDLTLSSVASRLVAGNHAYQATAARRPIFRDVDGLRYLEFDGVDDYLRATFTIALPIDRVSAIQQVTWAVSDQLLSGVTTNQTALYQQTTTPALAIFNGSIGPTLSPVLAVGVNGVITERYVAGGSKIALNSGAYVTADAGTGVPGGLTIGASFTPGAYGNIHLHQLIERGSTTAMTDAEIYTAKKLAAYKSGVLL